MRTKTKQTKFSHFHFPAQFLLGLLFFSSGLLLLLKYFGKNYLTFVPETFLVIICALGSLLGGFYLIITKFWRPRIYL